MLIVDRDKVRFSGKPENSRGSFRHGLVNLPDGFSILPEDQTCIYILLRVTYLKSTSVKKLPVNMAPILFWLQNIDMYIHRLQRWSPNTFLLTLVIFFRIFYSCNTLRASDSNMF